MTLKLFIPLMMFSGLTLPSYGLIIDNYTANKNRMLNKDASFITNAVNMDLSGMGISSNGRFATLIAPDLYLTALHYAPSGSINFYANNDPNQVVTRQIDASQGQRVGNTDLYIGKLTAPVSPNIKHYRYDPDINTLTGNTVVYMAGLNGSSLIVGRNRLSRFRDETFSGSTADSLWTSKSSSSDSSYDIHESQMQVGDSGSSLFMASNTGEITILGTAWFIDSFSSPTNPRQASVYSYTGSYTKEINQFVSRNSAPEPTSIALLAVGVISLLNRRVK